jgi:mannitol/fructose-specific phosphotransferase system IIA component (Ntr-type)
VETVERHYNITLEWTSHTISVAKANASVANLLGLKIGDAVLFTESILYDDAGNKVETGLAWFRPDRFRLKTNTRRAQNEPFYSMLGRTISTGSHPAGLDVTSHLTNRTESARRLAEFLPVERISINHRAETWQGAIIHAGKLLHITGATEERYGPAMVMTARQLGPYFVVAPGIAVSHALPQEGVITPALALVTLQPSLAFGNAENDPVRLLIAIAAVDTQQHVEALKEIADVLSDPIRKKALMQAATPEEAFEILTKK